MTWCKHPDVQIQFATSQSFAVQWLSDIYPQAPHLPLIAGEDAPLAQADVVFLCLPHAAAAETAVIDSADLTTTAVVSNYGVELSGDAAMNGEPGEVVTYSMTVTNTGDVMDTFTIAISDVWGATAPADVTIAAGMSSTFDVVVTVPASANNGDSDVATVTVTSVNDAAATDSSDLTTTADDGMFIIYLPIVMKQ